ncbi:MAG: hypothetical protein SWK90_04435 [Chloroflexota bacterium]|nr:hypothetical protein [Chloroflexota bacterium]
MMRRTRSVIGVGVLLLLVLNSLACSISGEVNVDAPLDTPSASEEEPAVPTMLPAEPTAPPEADTPHPAEVTPPPETTTPQPTEAPATADTPVPTVPPPPAPPAEMPAGQEPLEVAEIPELEVTTLDPSGEGLGHLNTFRQRMTVNFTAQDTGYAGVYHYDADVNTAEQAMHITISAEGPAAQELPANQVQAIWIGPQLWLKLGNQPWLPVPESVAEIQFDEQLLSVSDFLPYVQYFQRVGEEMVSGISSVHYTYDAQDLPTQYGSVSGHGDVYVALEGGYVVRYTLDGSGTFEDYFQGSGTLHLVYDTYDVGAPISIQAPRRL